VIMLHVVSLSHAAGNSRVSSEAVDAERDLSVVYEDVRLFPQEPCNVEGSFARVLLSLLYYCHE